jgi:hypothetical protein
VSTSATLPTSASTSPPRFTDWLVVAGTRAQFKGDGTISGEGDYGFLVTASDGDLNNNPQPDTFRIKIWDRTTDQIIYDNQPGDEDTAAATTSLEGGSIRIHQPK